MTTEAQRRAACRASNPHRARLDEIDAQLDTNAADLAAVVQTAKEAKWALMRERAALMDDNEKAHNFWVFMHAEIAHGDRAKEMTINELCVHALNHTTEIDGLTEAVLSEIYTRAGYVYEEPKEETP